MKPLRFWAFLLLASTGCAATSSAPTEPYIERERPRITRSTDDSRLTLTGNRVPIRKTAFGPTEEAASTAAYFAALNDAMVQLAGDQADAELGEHFRRELARDPTAFRERYFTADTTHRCAKQGGDYLCEVQGSLKYAAMRREVRRITRRTESVISQELVFVLVSQARGTDAEYLLDDLRGAIEASGHQVLVDEESNRALEQGRVDFALAIVSLDLKRDPYDTYGQSQSGTLVLQFKVNDLRRKMGVGTFPVTREATVFAPSASASGTKLRAQLSKLAAAEINAKVNNAIRQVQLEKGDKIEARARAVSGNRLYFVRCENLSQSDRADIRRIRQLLSREFPDSNPGVDASESRSGQVTIRFTTGSEVVPDDLVDQFYEHLGSDPEGFEAEYVGEHEFRISF
jgi:hypothetical protein